MLTRKLLLLSVAIPLAGMPMTVAGQAAPLDAHLQSAAAGSAILVAQANEDQPTAEELKKRRQEMRAKQREEKQQQRSEKKNAPDENQNGEARPKKQAPEGKAEAQPERQKPNAEDQSAKDQAKPERRKHKPDEQQASPEKQKHHERKADKQDNAPAKAEQAPAQKPQDDNAQSAKPSDAQAEKPKRHERADDKRKKHRDQADEQNQKQNQKEAAAPDENGKQAPDQQAGEKKPAAKEQKPSNQAGKQPLPDQPTRNAAAPQKNGEKPQRLDVQNGAAVFDSEKGPERHHRDDRNRDRQANDNQPNRQRQQADDHRPRKPVRVRSAESQHGEEIKQAPQFRLPQDAKVEKRTNNRIILNIDNRTIIQNDDHSRLTHDARDVRYERLPGGNTRQVVVRPNGVRIVTIRNSYGDIVHRSRIGRNGDEIVLIYAPQDDRNDRDFYRQPDLPPLRLDEPVDEYILDARHADRREYVQFLEKPPIEPVRQVYTLDQVRYSARLRDVMPRIDMDTITFDTGSSAIGPGASRALSDLAQAINAVLDRDPGQIFMIEGHTDAVGSDQSNLVLSDERAESAASVLTQDYNVPPENLVTQGYGEEYLKVDTDGPERANRRVTVRRITPLVRPEVQNN